jgi:hypothetical protein
VKVQLRPSAYGGVTAVILIPEELVVVDQEEYAARTSVPRQREHMTALPQALLGPNGAHNGATRATLYRELSTAQRPAIGASPTTTVDPAVSSDPISPTPTTIPRHARQEIIEAPLTSGPDGLPRRVRQTNIAPQLRDEPPPASDSGPADSAARSPDELRAMMSSFQAGMIRGRRDAAEIDEASGTPERDAQ